MTNWRDVKELYADEDGSFLYASDYDPLLKSFGYDVMLQVEDGTWQGDTRVLYRDGNRWGILVFGWGSCSGCDALQACSTFEDVEDLQRAIHNDIAWFESAAAALEYMQTHDWEGDYSYDARFNSEATRILTEAINAQQA